MRQEPPTAHAIALRRSWHGPVCCASAGCACLPLPVADCNGVGGGELVGARDTAQQCIRRYVDEGEYDGVDKQVCRRKMGYLIAVCDVGGAASGNFRVS